jgi:hypothetical protein
VGRQGTPNGGLNEIAERAYINGADFTLVAYTNAQDSLGPNTVAADLTQPTQSNGYAPLVLNGTWSVNNGLLAYAHPAGPNTDSLGNPGWFPTGAWSAGVTGIALLAGSRVLHYCDHRDGAGTPATFVAAAGRRLVVDLATLVA